MEASGLALLTSAGITTTRTWGALYVGVGLSGLAMAAYRDWLLPGLLLVVLAGLSILAARVLGIWIDGIDQRQLIELRREGIGFFLGLSGLVVGLAAVRRRE